jgi:transposase
MKVRFTQLNPRLSHRFAGFTGVLEKTDKKDAQILEDYGRLVKPKATIPDEDVQIELHNLYVLRNALAKERGEWKQRKHQHKQGIAKRVVEKVSTALDKEIAALDDTIEQKIISMETYKDIYKEIVKIVGVGRNTACAILCLLPEVGTLCSNKICKLAGLAPIANESGISIKKTAHTQGGRKHLRTALYMPCMTACSYNPVIRACFQRIKARKGGDEVKGAGAIALTACMRKLLKHINSVARKVREEMQRNVAAEGGGEAAQASPCR